MNTSPSITLPESWVTSDDYATDLPRVSSARFLEVSDLLFERANLNSTHLFRADILSDSAHHFQLVPEGDVSDGDRGRDKGLVLNDVDDADDLVAPSIAGCRLDRTLLRRLIPRKPQLDKPLKQSCYVYSGTNQNSVQLSVTSLVLYQPHVRTKHDVPWYHPQVRALAYVYEENEADPSARLSVHFLPFENLEDQTLVRLDRTFRSLLQTYVRLLKLPSQQTTPHSPEASESHVPGRSVAPSAIRDTILPQYVVQDTYTHLKQKYASDLIERWVESTEPSKHVFEDLSIAAFLIELWRTMYDKSQFPGFVDIACGNGVLVYILIKEGYHGFGFDARKRKTWNILEIENHLQESLCVPQPFIDALGKESMDILPGTLVHNGVFDINTFIISNHADELTPWTPILAALSNPEAPLPFLSIPCCSHALSGIKHRYSLKEVQAHAPPQPANESNKREIRLDAESDYLEEQPSSGDLKALRAAKNKGTGHKEDASMYACLTKKTVALAEELGFETELTLMRIPSTRNVGIVGGRHRLARHDMAHVRQRISTLLERECATTGGLHASAQMWVARAQKLQEGVGRGKVNLGAAPIMLRQPNTR